jgi:hypothetical protein
MRMADQTIVFVNEMGRMGNQMAQLMFAKTLQKRCRRSISIQGYDLPDWNLSAPRTQGCARPDLSLGSHLTRVEYVAKLIDWLRPDSVSIDGVMLRVDNFLPAADYGDLFPLHSEEGTQSADDELLISVRLGDVAKPFHPDYGPLPISYYQYLTERTGLKPVFMGELDDSPYCQTLRETFPDATFLPNHGVRGDFQTIRRAKNIAVSVSSFSWLAAYLSTAKRVHIPVAGMLDPRTRPDIDMLPMRDGRFEFHDVAASAWQQRYIECFPPAEFFQPLPPSDIAKIKKTAARRSAPKNLRIHAGLLRRTLGLGHKPTTSEKWGGQYLQP